VKVIIWLMVRRFYNVRRAFSGSFGLTGLPVRGSELQSAVLLTKLGVAIS